MPDGDASDQSGVACNRRRMDTIVDGKGAALPATNGEPRRYGPADECHELPDRRDPPGERLPACKE